MERQEEVHVKQLIKWTVLSEIVYQLVLAVNKWPQNLVVKTIAILFSSLFCGLLGGSSGLR